MKQTILLLFLFMVGLMPAKADNITVDGTSRSYVVRFLSSVMATIRMPVGCRTASSKMTR